ncbi:MAG: 23S rRNA pseudouridine(1911/1915/1917) synthase RluD [Thiobacillus sp.]|jgi:23S rRNA pseudouridine1911/1915/1917 synthase|uniref:23S rRNA pseudouridine(1911/1915/1917) synthase RluD n=1 Tax=Thiobacillus sp. TaxID=924 RepID=UPI0028956440|nr:23S rRNA pseudouridine(1911/1915/1917) synthase RluD [Thiobacillus sp.]MDT3707662.1 23S rRNA pseudouridine(1911/1915/1917) synthase RluD [Thiobacillus sp.]
MGKDTGNSSNDYKGNTLGSVRELVIPDAQGGQRLDQALSALLPEFSRNRIQNWIRARKIVVDDAFAVTKMKVSGGEAVRVEIEPDVGATPDAPQDIPLDVVFEDASLLVVNKPVGLVVHPGSGNPHGTLLNALLHRVPQVAELPRAGIVHRLDKDTSGLLVVAKTLQAHTDLVRQLQARTVKREYLALLYGEVDHNGTVNAPLARDPFNRTKRTVHHAGKEAVTHYEVVERFPGVTLVRCKLETGRTHQIRVHMQHIGHPLVGEQVYGAGRRSHHRITFPRQALHAERLGLLHPVRGAYMQWECALPSDFAALLGALRDGTAWES